MLGLDNNARFQSVLVGNISWLAGTVVEWSFHVLGVTGSNPGEA